MGFGSNQLRAMYEPTRSMTYVSDREAYWGTSPGGDAGSLWFTMFRLPTLNRPRTMNVSAQRIVYITDTNGIVVSQNTGSGLYFRHANAALLASYGIVLNTTDVFHVGTWDAGNAVVDPNKYVSGILVNGVYIPAPEVINSTPPGIRSDYFIGSYVGMSGFVDAGRFYWLGNAFFRCTAAEYLPIARALYNGGVTSDPWHHPYLRRFVVDDIQVDPKNLRSNSHLHGKREYDALRFFPGLSVQMIANQLAGKVKPVRGKSAAWPADAAIVQSQQVQDYLYEGADPFVGGQLTGIFNYDSEGYRLDRLASTRSFTCSVIGCAASRRAR
jgi:hypothetical protein